MAVGISDSPHASTASSTLPSSGDNRIAAALVGQRQPPPARLARPGHHTSAVTTHATADAPLARTAAVGDDMADTSTTQARHLQRLLHGPPVSTGNRRDING